MSILEPLTDWVFKLMENILYMFPEASETLQALPADIASHTYWVGHIVNTEALMYVVGTIVVYEVVMITIRVSLFVYRLLPFT